MMPMNIANAYSVTPELFYNNVILMGQNVRERDAKRAI